MAGRDQRRADVENVDRLGLEVAGLEDLLLARPQGLELLFVDTGEEDSVRIHAVCDGEVSEGPPFAVVTFVGRNGADTIVARRGGALPDRRLELAGPHCGGL